MIAQCVRYELMQLGYHIYGQAGFSNGITALILPSVLEGLDWRVELENKYGVFVGKGLGQLQGKVIRIAHYGNFEIEDVPTIITVFRDILE